MVMIFSKIRELEDTINWTKTELLSTYSQCYFLLFKNALGQSQRLFCLNVSSCKSYSVTLVAGIVNCYYDHILLSHEVVRIELARLKQYGCNSKVLRSVAKQDDWLKIDDSLLNVNLHKPAYS